MHKIRDRKARCDRSNRSAGLTLEDLDCIVRLSASPWNPVEITPMNTKLSAAILVVGSVATAAPRLVHRSFAAEFDEHQPVTLKGTLTRLEWVNPHGWLYMDVKEPDGKVVTWAIETGAPNSLLKRGLRKTDFQPGTEIVVNGYRA